MLLNDPHDAKWRQYAFNVLRVKFKICTYYIFMNLANLPIPMNKNLNLNFTKVFSFKLFIQLKKTYIFGNKFLIFL